MLLPPTTGFLPYIKRTFKDSSLGNRRLWHGLCPFNRRTIKSETAKLAMKKRILLAEDNKDVAELLTTALSFLGYEVALVRNGIEAVESAISLPPNVIVMDMLMPKLDGFQVASQLRQHPETKTIPILAATALSRPEDRNRCLVSGCNDCIVKPFTPHELVSAIEKLLRDRPGEQSKHGLPP